MTLTIERKQFNKHSSGTYFMPGLCWKMRTENEYNIVCMYLEGTYEQTGKSTGTTAVVVRIKKRE